MIDGDRFALGVSVASLALREGGGEAIIPHSGYRSGRTRISHLGVGVIASFLLVRAACADEKITYQDHLLPIIENNCGKCHNPDKKKGDLDLTSYNGLLKGGGSG